jgi:hypothetical protein
MIPTVTLPPPPMRGRYARHVLEAGHEPGVLSGAALRGRARRYGGWYYRIRRRVMEHAAAHGVEARLVMLPDRKRSARVWVSSDGAPVRVVIRE